jgi:hypothetical protein
MREDITPPIHRWALLLSLDRHSTINLHITYLWAPNGTNLFNEAPFKRTSADISIGVRPLQLQKYKIYSSHLCLTFQLFSVDPIAFPKHPAYWLLLHISIVSGPKEKVEASKASNHQRSGWLPLLSSLSYLYYLLCGPDCPLRTPHRLIVASLLEFDS